MGSSILLYILIIGIIIGFIILIFNRFVRYKNNVKRAKSTIDVYLQQRFDLIPNLVEVTKSYTQYGKDTLENISKLRSEFNKTKDFATSNKLNNEYLKIMGIIENLPKIKANEQYLKIQKSLSKIESELQAARRIYNTEVTKYNSTITTFPGNIFAKLFGFKEIELFTLEGEREIKIEL